MSAAPISMAKMEQAAAWFRDAWSGKVERYPRPEECSMFATALDVVASQIGRAPAKPEPRESLKHGRLFLQHARQEISASALWTGAAVDAAIIAVDAVEAQIKAAMEALKDLPQARPFSNPAAFLAQWAEYTWTSIDVKAPLNPNDGYPLCSFVVLALESIDLSLPSATVSEYIRGRRRPEWWGQRD